MLLLFVVLPPYLLDTPTICEWVYSHRSYKPHPLGFRTGPWRTLLQIKNHVLFLVLFKHKLMSSLVHSFASNICHCSRLLLSPVVVISPSHLYSSSEVSLVFVSSVGGASAFRPTCFIHCIDMSLPHQPLFIN